MICPQCHGKRWRWEELMPGANIQCPRECNYCKGQGYLHCCEGMVAQPSAGAINSLPSRENKVVFYYLSPYSSTLDP